MASAQETMRAFYTLAIRAFPFLAKGFRRRHSSLAKVIQSDAWQARVQPLDRFMAEDQDQDAMNLALPHHVYSLAADSIVRIGWDWWDGGHPHILDIVTPKEPHYKLQSGAGYWEITPDGTNRYVRGSAYMEQKSYTASSDGYCKIGNSKSYVHVKQENADNGDIDVHAGSGAKVTVDNEDGATLEMDGSSITLSTSGPIPGSGATVSMDGDAISIQALSGPGVEIGVSGDGTLLMQNGLGGVISILPTGAIEITNVGGNGLHVPASGAATMT